MEDIKIITNEIKEGLEKYDFKQKGTSRLFYYDCKWYVIIAELLTGKDIAVINGIKFLWQFDNLLPIREVTKDDLNYYIKETSPTIIEEACLWINSKKEYFLKIYENPTNMLVFFKNHIDFHRYPHDYILARMLNDSVETEYFENRAKNYVIEVNKNSGIYFTYGSEKPFRIMEADINYIIKLSDTEFVDEMNKRINENRKKLKLKTYEKYFE